MLYPFENSGELKPMTEAELAEADKGSFLIVCEQGIDENGRPYWLYLGVKPSKYKAFMQLADKKQIPVVFEEYGEILEYGFDKEVPEGIRLYMKEEYGCDENYLALLKQEVEKARAAFLKERDTLETERFTALAAMLKQKPSQE